MKTCFFKYACLPALGLALMMAGALSAQSDAIQSDVPALKTVYAHDFYIGCLLSYRHVGFTTDPQIPGQSAVVAPNGGNLINYHMNSMSPGNNMKPLYTVDIAASAAAFKSATAAQKDSVDTHPVIRFSADLIAQLNWAQRQGFTFRGHTLVWHSQTPAELFRSGYTTSGARLSREKMIERMDHYIGSVIRLIHENWPGLLSAMDVVNEAITDAGLDRTDSEWYLTFGDNTYLMKAFELTRKHTLALGEGQIKLYYNDYNTHLAAKADGIVRVCTPIFQAGYLDGLGMQEHDSNSSPSARQWIETYDKFFPICTEMAVTELDVTTGSATPAAAVLQTQAYQYGQLFKCFVERSYFSGRGKIISVSKDGLNDQYTFKTNQSSSLWDAKNKCKPAFYAAVDVGRYFNVLDSLLLAVQTLQESDYTTASWAGLAGAAAYGEHTLTAQYSAALSAADSLRKGVEMLQAGLLGLTRISSGADPVRSLAAPQFTLCQNYPNPFNPETRIDFTLPAGSQVELRIYDLLGREVLCPVDAYLGAGAHSVQIQAAGLESGTYFYQLKAGREVMTRRMTLLQ
ncbi:MAG TPA: endo-1,4-beta-xylanase [bacterium]|nr:endo-1,4-beta-xylanase [bacterium]HPR89022.1 endo-1,4-beta-xylanase [bacterium]